MNKFFKIKDHMEANLNQISLQVEWLSFVASDTRINPVHSQSVNLTNIFLENLQSLKISRTEQISLDLDNTVWATCWEKASKLDLLEEFKCVQFPLTCSE